MGGPWAVVLVSHEQDPGSCLAWHLGWGQGCSGLMGDDRVEIWKQKLWWENTQPSPRWLPGEMWLSERERWAQAEAELGGTEQGARAGQPLLPLGSISELASPLAPCIEGLTRPGLGQALWLRKPGCKAVPIWPLLWLCASRQDLLKGQSVTKPLINS